MESEYSITPEAIELAVQHLPALEYLLEDFVPRETAARIVVSCVKQGKDPMEFAKHFVKLRKAFRGENA